MHLLDAQPEVLYQQPLELTELTVGKRSARRRHKPRPEPVKPSPLLLEIVDATVAAQAPKPKRTVTCCECGVGSCSWGPMITREVDG